MYYQCCFTGLHHPKKISGGASADKCQCVCEGRKWTLISQREDNTDKLLCVNAVCVCSLFTFMITCYVTYTSYMSESTVYHVLCKPGMYHIGVSYCHIYRSVFAGSHLYFFC